MESAPAPAPAPTPGAAPSQLNPTPEFLLLQAAVAGRYSLERELGRGGMGVVFLARDVALDRPVAIKLLPPGLASRDVVRERFLSEARIAAKLSHPNIVPIHAVEAAGDVVFFVMSYVSGGTLGERVAAGPLSVADAVPMLREIAWALSYAHSQGVIHQDIKPDNILLEKGTGRSLVTDFGIARVSSAEPASSPLDVVGTPEFMAPEHAMGEPVDARSDLYALGVVAFVTLSGSLPFDRGTPAEIVAHHIRTRPRRLTKVARGVPAKLALIVDKCLEKDPDDRFQTGAEVAEALGTVLEQRGEIPVPVRVFIRESPPGRYALFLLLFLYLLFPFLGLAWWALDQGALGVLGVTGVLAGAIATPVALVVRRARRVVKAGLTREDLLHALETEAARRQEELAFVYGDDHAVKARKLIKLSRGLLLAGVASLGVAAIGSSASVWITAGVVSILAGAVAGSRGSQRWDWAGQRRLKFWRSRVGRWIFRLASWGRPPTGTPEIPANRATEYAIGTAILGLFEALPRETREALPELPDVVHRLEDDAQKMRMRVDEMAELLTHSDDAAPSDTLPDAWLDTRRAHAVERITEARDEAQRRLTHTVAALENLRLDLLRMRAGAVALDSVTASVGEAAELAEQVDRLLAGHGEIEQALRDEPNR
jgi:eukaryotic-like serine/threonine-protein kinase